MPFKISDMHDVGRKPEKPITESNKKWYPSIDLSEKTLAALKKLKFKEDVTLHAHGKITGKHQYNDEPANFTIELHDIGIKAGHNPRAKWMSDAQFERYERCLDHLKNKKGINRYAVCAASIKKSEKNRKRAISKLK